ncbi:recombinase family protein [Roseovarius sp. MMSF_3359]
MRILDLGSSTSNGAGQLMLNVLRAVAQFERKMMLARPRKGNAKAKALGK